MKKFLSIVLSVALVLSLFGMNVLAVNDLPNPITVKGNYHVVGQQGEGNDLANGEASFTPGSVNANVTVNFNHTNDDPNSPGSGDAIVDRYAIDIEYKDLIIDLTQIPNTYKKNDQNIKVTYEWNVNTHSYEKIETPVTVTPDYSAVDNIDTTPLEFDTFQVTNHSSLPIWYGAGCTLNSAAMTATLPDFVNDPDHIFELARATTGQATTSGYYKMSVIPNSADANTDTWVEVLNALTEAGYVTGSSIGTITVTFAQTLETVPDPATP